MLITPAAVTGAVDPAATAPSTDPVDPSGSDADTRKEGSGDGADPPSMADLPADDRARLRRLAQRSPLSVDGPDDARDRPAPAGEGVAALLDEDGLTSLRALAEEARTRVAERLDAEVPPLPSKDARAASDGASTASHWSGTFRSGVPGGDLTGEGLADVLVTEVNFTSSTIRIVGVNESGAPLWNESYAAADGYVDAFPARLGDVDGDGAEDVVILTLRLRGDDQIGTCLLVACAVQEEVEFTWGLEVVSGPTGDTKWTHEADGFVRVTFAGVFAIAADTVNYVVESENLLVFPDRLVHEAYRGAAGQDVLVNEFDVDLVVTYNFGGFVAYALVYEAAYVFETDYLLRDGATGDILLEERLGPNLDLPYAVPAGDLTGDGHVDLFRFEPQFVPGPVVCAFALVGVCGDARRGPHMRVSAQDPTTGDVLWTLDRTDATVQYHVPFVVGDHTGDGADDVLIAGYGELRNRFTAVDGADGTTAWHRSSRGLLPLEVGDVDGDGSDDVLLFGFTSRYTARLEAFSGPDGDVLYRNHVATGLDDPLVVFPLATTDLDADGAGDVLLIEIDIVCQSHCRLDLATTAADSSTGQAIWHLQGVALPGGRLDDAPGQDLLTITESETDCVETTVLDARNGVDLDPLWNVSQSTPIVAGLVGRPADGTFDGHPSEDVIANAYVLENATFSSRVAAVTGDDGIELWSFGDALPAPDCSGGGGDGGTASQYIAEEIPVRDVDTSDWSTVHLGDDDLERRSIPETPFFDANVTEMAISSNGFVGLGDYDGDDGCCEGEPIPQDDDVDGIVAGLWTDLDPHECGEVRLNVTDDRIRLAFHDVPYYGEPCDPVLPGEESERVRFRIDVWTSNGTAEVHLFRVDGEYTATTGIESPDGTVGNQTRRTAAELPDPVAWRFTLERSSGTGDTDGLTAEGGVEQVTVTGADPGALVRLYDAQDTVVNSTLADSDGNATFHGVEPGTGYYATQTVDGNESAPSNRVDVQPPAPDAEGGEGNVTASGFDQAATLTLYDADGQVVARTDDATGASHTFTGVPPGEGYTVTQTVNGVESPPSDPVEVVAGDTRTPDDALPGHEPDRAGNGSAYWNITGRSQLAANALFYGAGPCASDTFLGPAPVGSECDDGYDLSLKGDETLVEARLTWGSNRTDLNLHLRDPSGRYVDNSVHGQVFVNKLCQTIGECIFVFPPNGTTWEHVDAIQPELFAGAWSLNVTERNNWRTDHVEAAATGGDSVPYTLEVWVSTVPGAEPTHDPAA